jgi:hypothetical protein
LQLEEASRVSSLAFAFGVASYGNISQERLLSSPYLSLFLCFNPLVESETRFCMMKFAEEDENTKWERNETMTHPFP